MAQISATNLKVLSFEPEGKYASLEMQGRLHGWPQTIARDSESLIRHLYGHEDKPDIILLYDDSVPPMGGLTDVFRIATGRKIRLPEDMPGAVLLKTLKDPESIYRDIPVVVYGAFDREPFLSCGAAGVVTSEDSMDMAALPQAMAKALSVDGVEDGPRLSFSRKDGVEIIAPAPEDDPIDYDLTGDQTENLPLHLRRAGEMILRPGFVLGHVLGAPMRKLLDGTGLYSELKRRGEKDIAETAAKLMLQIANGAEDAPFRTKEDAMALIRKTIADSGERPGWMVHFLLLKGAAQAMYDCKRNFFPKDISAELDQSQIYSFRSRLENRIAYLDHTGTLEMQESIRAFKDAGDLDFADLSPEAKAGFDDLDEKAIAREAAAIFKAFLSLDAVQSATTTYEFERELEMLLSHARTETRSVVDVCFKQAIADVLSETVSTLPRCTRAQLSRITSALADRCDDPSTGPKTQALLAELAERLKPGMNRDNMVSLAGTLAQFRKFGGEEGVPGRNAVRDLSRAVDQAMAQPVPRPPAPPDQPRLSP